METAAAEKIQTKYGTAIIGNRGYYRITSRKEGNKNKFLHRLVFEDYNDCILDKNDVIHHIDGDVLNNHPANLICMSKKAHNKLHNTNPNKCRLKKDGKSPEGKQLYSIILNGKRVKSSIHKDKMEKYLKELKGDE